MKILGFEINRIKNISNIEKKTSRTAILNTQYGTAHWPDRDYSKYAKESYMKNVIAFRCIFYISTNLAQVKWGLFKQIDTEREEITNDPINKILKRANPDESFTYLIQKAISYLLMSGNTYFERVGAIGGINKGVPRELYNLRPDKMTINTNKDTGIISSYEYDNKLKFEVNPITKKSDILQIKLFNPTDDYFGLSITEPTAREIDASNEATEWQKKVFENEGRPGMMLFVSGFLSDEQFDRLEKQLKNNYSGSANAGRNLILEGEQKGDAKPYSWSPAEMDWIESNRELARRICLGYGVPSMLLGIPGDNTYSNYKEARAAFWEETILFYLDLFKGELNNWLFETDEKFIDYDVSNIPALAYKQEIIWARIKEASFMTINEKRESVGLEKYNDPAADMLFVPFGQVPLEQVIQDMENSQNEQTETDIQDNEEEEVQKLIRDGMDEKIARAMVGNTY